MKHLQHDLSSYGSLDPSLDEPWISAPVKSPFGERDRLTQVAELLRQAMQLLWGDLLETEGMEETPARVARHWATITRGLHEDPVQPLERTFSADHDDLVLIREIPFCSLCEHHLLPFFGVAHVGYIPQGRVVGLSKIPRSLDILAARPQMQEQLTRQLATLIQTTLNPLGTVVVIEAEHTCMSTRGVLKPGAKTLTQAFMGTFKTDAAARKNALTLIRQ